MVYAIWRDERITKMQTTWYLYFIFFIIVFCIYLPKKRRRRYIGKQLMAKKKLMQENDGREEMKELIQQFVGKDVYIKLLDGNADGIVKEVTDSGVVLENKGNLQVLNLDYVIKVREYPYKNGKRATLWGES